MMHDMSKAFDSVNRTVLINNLNKILEKDEVHLLQLMINVYISVKCGKYNSDFFQTDTGVPQGDCASANEFTFYLAKALLSDNQAYEHDYAKNIEIPIISKIQTEHNYNKPQTKKHIDINQEYADDISQITSNRETILQRKLNCPRRRAQRAVGAFIDIPAPEG